MSEAGLRDLWAWCKSCARWFFVPRAEQPVHHRVTCPVCSDTATQFEGRDPTGVEDPQRIGQAEPPKKG